MYDFIKKKANDILDWDLDIEEDDTTGRKARSDNSLLSRLDYLEAKIFGSKSPNKPMLERIDALEAKICKPTNPGTPNERIADLEKKVFNASVSRSSRDNKSLDGRLEIIEEQLDLHPGSDDDYATRVSAAENILRGQTDDEKSLVERIKSLYEEIFG